MSFRKSVTAATFVAALAFVSACDSSDERAEKFYQSGLSYLQQGQVDKALVEFRNVFQLNGRHHDARLAYAQAEQKRGNLREAYGQYLRLNEQYPQDMDALRALAEIATMSGNWDEASRNITAGLAIAPNDGPLRVSKTMMDYGRASTDNDVSGMIAAATEARKLRQELPDNVTLRKIMIDDLLRAQDYVAGLNELNAAIALDPTDRTLYATRLSVYGAQGNTAAVESELLDLVKRFPDAAEMKDALVRWYVSRKEIDKAEAYMRSIVSANADDPQATLELIRFLAEYRGSDAAVAELDSMVGKGPASPILRSARAGFLFDMGKQDQAIVEMHDILKTAADPDEARKIKVGLARMEVVAGNAVGARALVEEVLSDDSGNVEALKLKAGWLILDDNVGEAITILRAALDQNPRDASIMTLMAQAYERDGNRDLMREMLGAAVDASGRAPEESLRYAQLLASENKLLPAESVLLDALRLAPDNMLLIVPLGQLYVLMKDWPRAEAVAKELDAINTADARDASAGVRTAILAGQEKTSEAVGYLEGLAAKDDAGLGTKIAVVRAHLANGQNAEALAYSGELLRAHPDDPNIRFVDASVRSVTGDFDGAEKTYRALLAEDPQRLPVWMALYRLLSAQADKTPAAATVLDDALKVLPDAGELKWAKAGFLERQGDFEGAIAIYEGLYKENSANPIVANNLASLLSTHHTDPDSLTRAEVIARRLKGSDIGPYQDTYGWIAFLRGDNDTALTELEKAAANIPQDGSVQYHLGKAYLAADRKPEALAQFQKAVSLVQPEDQSAYVLDSRKQIQALGAAGIKSSN